MLYRSPALHLTKWHSQLWRHQATQPSRQEKSYTWSNVSRSNAEPGRRANATTNYVTYQNQTYFLTPRYKIIIKSDTPRDCNELLPIMFKIHDSWFRSMPRLVETIPPPNIQPLTRPTWKYVNPAFLATSGIYSSNDLECLKSHIMFPVEKPSMLNIIAGGAMGQRIPEGSISMINFWRKISR